MADFLPVGWRLLTIAPIFSIFNCKGSLPRALLLVAVHSGPMSMLPVLGAIQQGLGFKEGACYGLALIEPFTVCFDDKAVGAEMSRDLD